jgi:hypothetical protein
MEVVIIRKVDLTMNEQKKYEVLKTLIEKNGSKKRAAVELGCTTRHIDRMIKGYAASGKSFFSHKNKGRKPACAIPEKTREAIILLYQNKYQDANIRHFTELLSSEENIFVSEGAVRAILLSADIISPKAHRTTKRALAAKLKSDELEAKTKKQKEEAKTNLFLALEPHPRRPRCRYAGEMIQTDASVYPWFNDEYTYLHVGIDDSTGTLTGAYFDYQETLKGYYNVSKQTIEKYGIPYMYYTDRRTIFDYKKKHKKKIENNTFTQFGYSCKQLGIELKVTSVSQAKGRVERLFQTLQSRLPVLLRLAGVTTLEQANEYLKSYLEKFNRQFALPIHSNRSVFVAQTKDMDLDLYLSVIQPRKIDAGHCIKYMNKYYRPLDETGTANDFYKGTEALVIKTLSGKLYCNILDNIYSLDEVLEHEKVSRYFDTEKATAKAKEPRPQSIPSMDHPWRKDNFMRYVHAMSGHEIDWAS